MFSDGVCHSYIQGVYDAGRLLDEDTNKRQWVGGWSACMPEEVSVGQLVAVVKKWLVEYPEGWHYDADSQVAKTFMKRGPAADPILRPNQRNLIAMQVENCSREDAQDQRRER